MTFLLDSSTKFSQEYTNKRSFDTSNDVTSAPSLLDSTNQNHVFSTSSATPASSLFSNDTSSQTQSTPTPNTNTLTPSATTPSSAKTDDEGQPKKKRKTSRWGGKASEAEAAAAFSATSESPTPTALTTSATSSNGTSTSPTSASTALVPSGATATASTSISPSENKKRSRWGDQKIPVPSNAAAIAKVLSPNQTELYIIQLRIQELNCKLVNPLEFEKPEERSPSPEPIYNDAGKRINTREQRLRDKIMKERAKLIEEAIKLNPGFLPPGGIPKSTRKSKIIPIPVDKYPEYNFIGLIIGPRGNTQKRMEKETGCKIAIRGKGSVKEGKTRKEALNAGADNEPLHVLVTGETQEAVDKAAAIIENLLIPVAEDKNEHKAKQLRELASINGTLREETICRVCGERGHKIYNCPNRTGAAWKPANVRCEVCGSDTHPTSDCRAKNMLPLKQMQLNTEYANFMAELTGEDSKSDAKKTETSTPTTTPAPSGEWTQEQQDQNQTQTDAQPQPQTQNQSFDGYSTTNFTQDQISMYGSTFPHAPPPPQTLPASSAPTMFPFQTQFENPNWTGDGTNRPLAPLAPMAPMPMGMLPPLPPLAPMTPWNDQMNQPPGPAPSFSPWPDQYYGVHPGMVVPPFRGMPPPPFPLAPSTLRPPPTSSKTTGQNGSTSSQSPN